MKTWKIIILLVIFCISLFGSFIGFVLFQSDNNFKKRARTTTGEIIKINTSRNNESYITVAFALNGQKYIKEFSKYSKHINKGQKVKIYYDYNNPNVFLCKYNMSYGLYIMIVCIVISIISLITVIFFQKKLT